MVKLESILEGARNLVLKPSELLDLYLKAVTQNSWFSNQVHLHIYNIYICISSHIYIYHILIWYSYDYDIHIEKGSFWGLQTFFWVPTHRTTVGCRGWSLVKMALNRFGHRWAIWVPSRWSRWDVDPEIKAQAGWKWELSFLLSHWHTQQLRTVARMQWSIVNVLMFRNDILALGFR